MSRALSSLTETGSICGTTIWTWAHCWRGCATDKRTIREAWAPGQQQQVPGAKSKPLRGRTATALPHRLLAACWTPTVGPHQTFVASAGKMGNHRGCTGPTSWRQTMGKWPALSSGTTPAPSVQPPGTMHTHEGTARRFSIRRLRGNCQGPGFE